MQLAPVFRRRLSEDQLLILAGCLSGEQSEPSKMYLEILKSAYYLPGKSERTFPLEEKKEDDDVEIIGTLARLSFFYLSRSESINLLEKCDNVIYNVLNHQGALTKDSGCDRNASSSLLTPLEVAV